MSPPDGSTTLTLNDSKDEEDRMRAALGLTPQHIHPSRPAEHSRHSGRDGEIPVTVVSTARSFEASDSSRARLAALTDELKAERGDRVAAQQALADARQTIQQLQTKLAHTEMAGAEALEAEQRARLAAEASLLELPPATTAEVENTATLKRRGRPPKIRQVGQELAEPKKIGRPPKIRQLAEEPEQEPVQWWLPGYKASKVKRARSKA